MVKAVIDLGTNTFNLLIVEINALNQITLLHQDKAGVGLGMGGIHKDILSNDAMERANACLQQFKSVCNTYGAQSIQAIGTSALRDAENAIQWIHEVNRDLGIKIEIISGQAEASLIFKGVECSTPLNDKGLIMDIGGGSTEFISYEKGTMTSADSLNIGITRIFQGFNLSDPLNEKDLKTLENYLDTNTASWQAPKFCNRFIGSSGSFESIYELIHKKNIPDPFKAEKIDILEFHDTLDYLMFSSLKDREDNPYLIPIRKLMAPIAAFKISWVLKKVEFEELWVSPCALKEGVLFS